MWATLVRGPTLVRQSASRTKVGPVRYIINKNRIYPTLVRYRNMWSFLSGAVIYEDSSGSQFSARIFV